MDAGEFRLSPGGRAEPGSQARPRRQQRGDRPTLAINHPTHERLQATSLQCRHRRVLPLACRQRQLARSAVSLTQFQSEFLRTWQNLVTTAPSQSPMITPPSLNRIITPPTQKPITTPTL